MLMSELRQYCVYVCTDDFSRVKLELVEGEEGSDYVNASYIDVSP